MAPQGRSPPSETSQPIEAASLRIEQTVQVSDVGIELEQSAQRTKAPKSHILTDISSMWHTQLSSPSPPATGSLIRKRVDKEEEDTYLVSSILKNSGAVQAYYGGGDRYGVDFLFAPGVPPAPGMAPGVGAQPLSVPQLFTPGLAAEDQFAVQQQFPQQPEYINVPGFGIGSCAGQFSATGGRGMGLGAGQRPFALYTTNLLTAPPDPRALHAPPPEIRIPANASISMSPFANADPSYQRCAINAVPTPSALLNRLKPPFGLVLNLYCSLKEGDQPVPLVTDTSIAHLPSLQDVHKPLCAIHRRREQMVLYALHDVQ
ncbi:hypothetical protein EW145_g3039 [Phellinidium pouzarii]|uniref:Uncharacterized protein n=1 Tax=Phellinidium pouzarii TaxID=167371 RepID=A0A4S4L8T6_9AGAM|nr:hypothetical protein EW145_g3039 [Phellinidium pouzarii]